MLLHGLLDAMKRQDWVTILLEIVIVVVGIFLGLQADGWNDQRKDRELERRYLERIHADIEEDIDEMKYALELARTRRDMGELLLAALDDPNVVKSDPQAFVTAIEQAGYTFLPVINDITFEELKFSGDLSIIQNERLRTAIAAYYKLIERYDQWAYLREAFQIEYANASLGILSPKQRKTIKPVRRYSDPPLEAIPVEVSTDEALQALERMREKDDFINQIVRSSSNGKGIELGNISVWKRSAEELQERIEAELGPNHL
jgi:hypothetical protein